VDAGDLDDIEAALDVRLPPEYRTLMQAYPFGANSQAAELWLPADPDAIVEDTLDARRAFAMREQRWPKDYVIVGGDGGEERYVLDASRQPAPVVVYELETGNVRPLAADTTAFAALLNHREAQIAADDAAMKRLDAGTRHGDGQGRWWQFWR
jgi:hypothetical protein